MREELGTVMASTPVLERVRSRKVFLLRRSSMESMRTGSLKAARLRMGWVRMRSRSSRVTFGFGASWAQAALAVAAAVMAADWRKVLLEVSMVEILTGVAG